MYSRLEIQNASSQQLKDYLFQPILPTADLEPICERLLILIESSNNSDDSEKEKLILLEKRLLEILAARDPKSKIGNSTSSLQALNPELQLINFFNAVPKELVHRILQELSFYEWLDLLPVSKQANKLIREMPLHDKYIFIKDIFLISIDQLNQEYDLAILTDKLEAIKPRRIYLSDKNGKLAYTVIPFNKSKPVQNIPTSLEVPENFSLQTLLTLKEEILRITTENNHTQEKTKSSWTYKELRKLDVLKNFIKEDDILVETYANEVQEDTRAKLPWLIRSPYGMMTLWCSFSMIFVIPMIIAEDKTLRYVNSTHNFTKYEQDLLSYVGDGLYAGGTLLSGLLSLLFILLLREKYVESSNNTARNEARQLFGFFKDGSSEEENSLLAEIEELKDEQCIIPFLSEDEEELLLWEESENLGSYDI
jgi:hypothetical protein